MSNDRKIRMGTGDVPDSQGHTIVGGRPAAVRQHGRNQPRGLELLMKKAAVDAEFKQKLITGRSTFAAEIGVPLDHAEQGMLDAMPTPHLEQLVALTPVAEPQRSLLKTASAAALVALLAQATLAPLPVGATSPGAPAPGISQEETKTMPPVGSRPPSTLEDDGRETWAGGARPDLPEDLEDDRMTRGIRPDFPGDMVKGIRPDRPPVIFQPQPEPVPVEPATPAEPLTPAEPTGDILQDHRVITKIEEQTFDQAIAALGAEAGLTISHVGLSDADLGKTLTIDAVDLPLGKALRRLCGEVAGEGGRFEILLEGTELVIRFGPTGPAVPGKLIDLDLPKPGDRPNDMTRGSRPDFPGRRP
jgi:hypothetical protein